MVRVHDLFWDPKPVLFTKRQVCVVEVNNFLPLR